jgi:hypothetical protein
MVKRIIQCKLAVVIAMLAATSVAQDLALRATVDRVVVQENESFVYLLRAQGVVRGEPDLAPLTINFDILQRSRNTSIQMVGGSTTRTTDWTLQLMPKGSGDFILPPIQLAGAVSNAVDLQVLAASATSASGDIFIDVEVSPAAPFVQSQAIYTMTLYRGVSTGRSSLTLPEVTGGEAIIEKLGQDREFQTVLDGRNFIALERRFAIFPQESGPLTISPMTFEAVVVSSSGFSNVQRYRSEPLSLEVRPAISPPAQYANAVWLPAIDLTLEERWSAGESELTTGIPQTRTLTIAAQGVLETQLPELELSQSEAIRQYADQPELGRDAEFEGIRARRTERFAVLAQSDGSQVLNEIELPWFNVAEERWEVATIAARVLNVLPSSQPAAIAPAMPIEDEPLTPTQSNGRLWQATSAALFAAWLLTLGLWWRSRYGAAGIEEDEAQPAPTRATARRLLRQLRKACDENNAVNAQQLLLDWAAQRHSTNPPLSLGALAARLPDGIGNAVCDLERERYGPQDEPWSGSALREALRRIDSVDQPIDITTADGLAPLYR